MQVGVTVLVLGLSLLVLRQKCSENHGLCRHCHPRQRGGSTVRGRLRHLTLTASPRARAAAPHTPRLHMWCVHMRTACRTSVMALAPRLLDWVFTDSNSS